MKKRTTLVKSILLVFSLVISSFSYAATDPAAYEALQHAALAPPAADETLNPYTHNALYVAAERYLPYTKELLYKWYPTLRQAQLDECPGWAIPLLIDPGIF